MDIDAIIAAKKPRIRTAYVLLDDALADERDSLVSEALLAERQDSWLNRRPEAPVLKQRISELDAEIAESKVAFTFMAMGRTEWRDLVAEHTPPDADDVDPETFGPAMIAESSVDAVTFKSNMTLKQATKLWGQWSAAETEALYIAAFRVNREVRDIPFTSVVTETTESSDSSLITASPEE